MKKKKEPQEQKPNENSLNSYIRYTAIAFQMGAIIGGGVWLGSWLDERQGNETPWYTIGIGLFSIFAALYLSLKDLLKAK